MFTKVSITRRVPAEGSLPAMRVPIGTGTLIEDDDWHALIITQTNKGNTVQTGDLLILCDAAIGKEIGWFTCHGGAFSLEAREPDPVPDPVD